MNDKVLRRANGVARSDGDPAANWFDGAVQVTLPDGTSLIARGRLVLVPADQHGRPDYGLYLDGRWSRDRDVT